MPRSHRHPQLAVQFPDGDAELVADAGRIAALRDERDSFGQGLSAVLRKALRRYVAQHRHLLEDD